MSPNYRRSNMTAHLLAPEGLECVVQNCGRPAAWFDGEQVLCERHMPDPSVRSWASMKAEGIEIETMAEYQNEVRGFNDYEPDPPDPGDEDYFREYEEPEYCSRCREEFSGGGCVCEPEGEGE